MHAISSEDCIQSELQYQFIASISTECDYCYGLTSGFTVNIAFMKGFIKFHNPDYVSSASFHAGILVSACIRPLLFCPRCNLSSLKIFDLDQHARRYRHLPPDWRLHASNDAVISEDFLIPLINSAT